MIARCPSAIPLVNFEKIKVYYLQNLGITQHTSGHTCRYVGRFQEEKEKEGGREGERERMHAGPGFCFYWGQGWGPRVSWVTLY